MSNGNEDYALAYPIVRKISGVDGEREERVDIVTIRRMKGKDLRAVGKVVTDEDKTMILIGRLGNLTQAEVDELDIADLEAIGEKVEGFIKRGRKIGKTASEI